MGYLIRRYALNTRSGAVFNFPADLDSTIEFDMGFTATSILHPATYLNKVLVASGQGNMQLWNIRSQFSFYFSRRRFSALTKLQNLHSQILVVSLGLGAERS